MVRCLPVHTHVEHKCILEQDVKCASNPRFHRIQVIQRLTIRITCAVLKISKFAYVNKHVVQLAAISIQFQETVLHAVFCSLCKGLFVHIQGSQCEVLAAYTLLIEGIYCSSLFDDHVKL